MSTGSPTAADTARRAALVGTAGYLFACVLWGLNLPLSAALLKHFDPFWVSPLRYVVATLLLGAMVLVSAGPAQLRSPIPLWRVAVLSLCVAGFLVRYNLGLFRNPPRTVAALSAGSPVDSGSKNLKEIFGNSGRTSPSAFSSIGRKVPSSFFSLVTIMRFSNS